MSMKVYSIAKWFIDNGLDNPHNTFKGNLKLQKMLFFAQLISLAKNDKLLFDDNFNAFENGMVIEEVRQTYKYRLYDFDNYNSNDLSKEDIEVLELTKDIYGNKDATTLSDMSHEFGYWKEYFNKSDNQGYYCKELSKVPNERLRDDIDRIQDVLYAHNYLSNNIDIACEGLDD